MILTRRHFFFGSLAAPAFAAKKPAGETPNIVLILVDNLPAWMLGCYGNKEVSTPGIDRLAQTGARFINHFAASPLPGPARACLLTGRTAVQLKDADSPGPEATLDKLLGAAGYMCQNVTSGPDAVKFVQEQTASKPFFLTAVFQDFAPPYTIGSRFADKYATPRFSTFAQEPPAANIARDREMFGANLLSNVRKAAAAVTAIDEQVAQMIAALSQKKILDNTLVIFTSPTGSLLGRHGLWGGADSSTPMNFYEEVVATPMIWTWPSRIAPLTARPELVSAIDLVPAICDLTPAELPDLRYTGRSYLLLAQGKPLPKKQPWRPTAFLSYRDSGVARDDRYKLVLRADGKGPNELYDLRVDAAEKVNQVDNPQFLTVKTELTNQFNRWKKV